MVKWWLLGQVQRCGWAHVSSHLIASAINRPWSLTFMLAWFFLVCVLAWVPRPFSLQLSVAPLMPPAKVGWRLRLYCATLTHHSHHLLLPYWKTALYCIIVSFRDCRVETCQIIHRSSSKYTLVIWSSVACIYSSVCESLRLTSPMLSQSVVQWIPFAQFVVVSFTYTGMVSENGLRCSCSVWLKMSSSPRIT